MNNNLIATLSACKTYEELLDALMPYADNDPEMLEALTATDDDLIYHSYPAWVWYKNNRVEGWAFDLYHDGHLVAHKEEC